MYEVEMKYADLFNVDTLNFTCENFNINDKGYKFENIWDAPWPPSRPTCF